MTWRVAAVILSALLCGMISSSLTAGVGDTTSLHWNNEIVSNHRLRSAESTRLHYYTREEADNHTASSWNCSRLYDSSYGYNESSCRFVRENCRAKAHLFDYLAFMKCDVPQKIKALGYIFLAIWCIYLISLLSTTVDNFFVPPLIYLAEKLNLPPSIAGITLLALGNGAPDIFCVYSGLGQGDLALVLGSLAGGAMFITSVIMATVILVTRKGTSNVSKVDFIRDSVTLVIVITIVVAVAFDGVVYLTEVLIFPLLYLSYIAVLLLITFLRSWWRKRLSINFKEIEEQSILDDDKSETIIIRDEGSESLKQIEDERVSSSSSSVASPLKRSLARSLAISQPLRMISRSCDELQKTTSSEVMPQSSESIRSSTSSPLQQHSLARSLALSQPLRMISKSCDVLQKSTLSEKKPLSDVREKPHVELQALTWPAGHHIIVKIIWAIQWPFSLLRWLTIPPFCPSDVTWTKWHYAFAVISSVPMMMLILLAAKGWPGFLMKVGVVPFPVIFIAIGIVISIVMAVFLRPNRPPHWVMLAVLVSLAFFMSIVWLNIIASEVVGVLTALGLLLNIKSAILGLTVLALGNCMADWVADSVVAKSGNTQMAFASCFGSPMLSHILGLSVAFAVRISVDNNGAPYVFDINVPQFSAVKLAWIFLGIALLSSIIMFPIFKFKPPLFYAISLICFYVVFVLIAVLSEIGIIPLLW